MKVKPNHYHQLKLKNKTMNFAYQVRCYSDKEVGTQLSAAEYAQMNGMVCMDGELDNLPNICVINVQQAPAPLSFVDNLTLEVYFLEPLEFVGTRPDPRR